MKIGTVGTGVIVEEFLNAVTEVENVNCVATYSRKQETASKLANKFNIKKTYTDYEALLNDKEIEFIYIALPNSLHYEYTLKALKAGKNVINEKPFTSTIEEAETLIKTSKEKKLFLFEAITTIHLPNYIKVRENLSKIGTIKLVQCNYSQYSSRYDRFLKGEFANVFTTKFSGGALYDINIYNLHFVTGLFGKAEDIKYFANIAPNGIDTSGIAILKYPNFICECTGAKDAESPSFVIIQGEKGYIKVNGPSNKCPSIEIKTKEGLENYNEQKYSNRMTYELIDFEKIFSEKDFEKCYELLNHSIKVIQTAVIARKDAQIVFEADK